MTSYLVDYFAEYKHWKAVCLESSWVVACCCCYYCSLCCHSGEGVIEVAVESKRRCFCRCLFEFSLVSDFRSVLSLTLVSLRKIDIVMSKVSLEVYFIK